MRVDIAPKSSKIMGGPISIFATHNAVSFLGDERGFMFQCHRAQERAQVYGGIRIIHRPWDTLESFDAVFLFCKSFLSFEFHSHLLIYYSMLNNLIQFRRIYRNRKQLQRGRRQSHCPRNSTLGRCQHIRIPKSNRSGVHLSTKISIHPMSHWERRSHRKES